MSRYCANAMLLMAAFLWASGNVAQKIAPAMIGPFTMLACRGILGLIAISPWLIEERRRRTNYRARLALSTLIASAMALSVPLILQLFAAKHASVTNLSFLLNTTIIFTPLLAWLSEKRRPDRRSCVAALTALTGVWLLSGGLSNLQSGDILRLLAAFAYAVWIIIVGRAVRVVDRPFLMPVCQFVAVASFGMMGGATEHPISAASFLQAGPEILLLGLSSSGLAFVMQAIAQREASATQAALVMSLAGVFGATMASILKGEGMTAARVIGAGTVVAAIVISEFGTRDAARMKRMLDALRMTVASRRKTSSA